MKVELPSVITSIVAKVDGSLGLRMATPELSTEEKTVILELQNKTINTVIETVDEPSPDVFKIDREIKQKTPGQRLRDVLYVLWREKKSKEWKDFESYYTYEMSRITEQLKSYID